LVIGAAFPIAAIELAFRVGGRVLTDFGGASPRSLLEGYLDWAKVVHHGGIRAPAAAWIEWSVPVALLQYFVHWQGWLMAIAGGFGVLIACGRRTPRSICGVIPVVLLALLSLQRHPIARAMAPAVPFACICAALGIGCVLGWVPRWGGVRLTGGLALLGAVAVPAWANARSMLGQRSGVAEAAAFVSDFGGRVVVPLDSAERSKYELFVRSGRNEVTHQRLYRLGTPEEVVEQFRREGVEWIIIDPQAWHYRDMQRRPNDEVYQWWCEYELLLEREAVLAAEFAHVADTRWWFLAEGPGLTLLPEMVRGGGGSIRVYGVSERARTIATMIQVSEFPKQEGDATHQ
jgi:hypothetical protein